jgi:hypothetical protein
MLTNNTQPAERPALTFNSMYSDADPCDVPDEPYITDYEPCQLVEYSPIKWHNNLALRCFVETIEYDEEPEFWDGSQNMVPYTLIEWLGSKAKMLYEDWIEYSFDIDRHPDWADLPF